MGIVVFGYGGAIPLSVYREIVVIKRGQIKLYCPLFVIVIYDFFI